jgi:hypothetical protein
MREHRKRQKLSARRRGHGTECIGYRISEA